MADSINDKVRRAGKAVDTDDTESIMKKFHRDFLRRSEKMLDYMKSSNDREIEIKKETTLNNITNKNKTVINNVSNSTSLVAASKTTSSAITTSGGSVKGTATADLGVLKEMVKLNTSVDKMVAYIDKNAAKENKKTLVQSLIQAKLLESIWGSIKQFVVDGPSGSMQIVHAVQNVERAIRGEKSTSLDLRSLWQKTVDDLKTTNGVLGELARHIPTQDDLKNKVFKAVDNAITNSFDAYNASDKRGGTDIGEKIAFILSESFFGLKSELKNTKDSIVSSLSNKDKQEKLKEATQKLDTGGDFLSFKLRRNKKQEKELKDTADEWIERFDWFLGKAVNNRLTNSKSGFLTTLGVFGDTWNFSLTSAILHPIKSIKIASKLLKITIKRAVEAPLISMVAAIGTLYGPMAGLASLVILPIAKIIRLFFIDISPKSLLGMFKIFGKKMGGMMGKMGKSIGMMGATAMRGIMVLISAAIAAWPIVLGAVIIAAVIGIAYYVYKKWDSIKKAFHDNIVQPIVDTFTAIIDSIKNFFTGIVDSVKGFVRDTFGDTVANSLFGEQEGSGETSDKTGAQSGGTTVIDRTQVHQGGTKIDKPDIGKMAQAAPSNDEFREMNKTLKESLGNIGNVANRAPAPLPAPNIDDVATYIITQ
jgi:F0F1-type ATP synthase epsilon subunit